MSDRGRRRGLAGCVGPQRRREGPPAVPGSPEVDARKTRRPVTFTNSVPFLIGVWISAACLLLPPIWFAVQGVLGGLGWVKNLGVVNLTLGALVFLIVAFVWALFAVFAARVTRDWAARRRYFQGRKAALRDHGLARNA